MHPQHWPEDLDHSGRQVVVIGSGATAITLVPALAETAGHVTMLQRSPTYVVSRPARDRFARRLSRLPTRMSFPLVRWANILSGIVTFQLSRRRPELVKRVVLKAARAQLPDVDVDVHFKPRYNPWDQRFCVVPNGDLFRALRKGRASIVTDTIERFDATGVELTSGEHLDADLIVTATGFQVLTFGGIELVVDGRPVDVGHTMAYKAMMLSGVPNFVFTIGYTNASWTLKADLISAYVVRLLRHLDGIGARSAVPVPDEDVQEQPIMEFTSGYVQRALDKLPKQGHREPWRLRQNYLVDLRTIKRAPIDDGVLAFDACPPERVTPLSVPFDDATHRRPVGSDNAPEVPMGFDDKVDNKGEELKGRAKEAAGSVSGDDELKNEGRADQAESSVKQAGEKVKDAVDDVKDAFKK